MKTIITLLALVVLAISATPTLAQSGNGPVTIAIFPFKNLYGEVVYDDLGWEYADSLAAYLYRQEGAGTTFQIVPMDDIRDQMLALNVDVKSPSYETDVWTIAEALQASKIIWGTYLVKYEKANIEAHVVDLATVMRDPVNNAKNIRIPYTEAITTIPKVGDKLLPGLGM